MDRLAQGQGSHQEIAHVVYQAMVAVGVPANTRFSVVSEHDADNFLLDAGYLGIDDLS